MRKKAFFLFLFGCVLILGCTTNKNTPHASDPEGMDINANHQSSQVEKKSANRKSDVPIIDFHLPPQNSKVRTENITHVVIHFISNAAIKPQDPYNVDDVYRIFLEYGISTHYMIGRNGEIFKLVDEDRIAFHSGKGNLPGFPAYQNKMNEYSIGIELLAVGTRNEMFPMMSGKTYDSIAPSHIGYTDAQYRSLNILLDDILKRHPSVLRNRKHVVGHDEYALGRKTDPGSLFDWARIGFKQPSGENQVHTVEKGESLWLIAKEYGTTIDAIAEGNDIDPYDYLRIGQELTIPK
jgi:N-acetyl-anhydromuramyl-L-alanine amidase AmpD